MSNRKTSVAVIAMLVCLLATSALALDTTLHGFLDIRGGVRTQSDPYEDDRSLSEARLQLDALTYFNWGEIQARGDFVYDDLDAMRDDVDLETGGGFFDLREFNASFTPVYWADLKVGRQILTWGTGDLLFINDLFPKDWNSFLLGRQTEYLKAPSDAVYASFFPSFGSLDVAYTPRFDADRYVDGSRVSYWNPVPPPGNLAGENAIIEADQRDEWFENGELSARFYRDYHGFETALYVYHGYWKSPQGFDLGTMNPYFPALNAYGASTKGLLGSGLFHLEMGYYDSRETDDANKIAPHDEVRFLMGYEREINQGLTASIQYYLERMLDYSEYFEASLNPATARDETRHVLTLRLSKMLMNQNLILGLFTFYSPSDQDGYFRPNATYKTSDNWALSAGGNVFVGTNEHTFFGQFKNNSNVNLSVRYSF